MTINYKILWLLYMSQTDVPRTATKSFFGSWQLGNLALSSFWLEICHEECWSDSFENYQAL